MQGKIQHYKELQDDDVINTILAITESSIEAPTGYFNYGVLNNELQFAESIIVSTRSAITVTERIHTNMHDTLKPTHGRLTVSHNLIH